MISSNRYTNGNILKSIYTYIDVAAFPSIFFLISFIFAYSNFFSKNLGFTFKSTSSSSNSLIYGTFSSIF